jgi:hypothetical protein
MSIVLACTAIDRTEKVCVKRSLVEEIVADHVAARDPSYPLVIGAGVAQKDM